MTTREPLDSEGIANPNRLRTYAGLFNDVAMLISEIEATRESSQDTRDDENDDKNKEKGSFQPNYTFTFEILGEHKVEIPPKIAELIPDLDQITVTLGQDDPAEPSYLSVGFMSDTRVINVSRSGDPEDTPELDYIIDVDTTDSANQTEVPFMPRTPRDIIRGETEEVFKGRISPINKISQAELNTLLMSLVYPSASREYTAFEIVNFLDRDVFDSLVESFQLAALNNLSTPMYTFSKSETQFSYIKADGQPNAFMLRYPEHRTGRTIVALNNLETDFSLVFNTYETIEHQLKTPNGVSIGKVIVGEGAPYYPTINELEYLRSLIRAETRAISPEEVQVVEDEIIDETTPETVFEDSGKAGLIYSETYIQNKLDQLDGDGPETDVA